MSDSKTDALNKPISMTEWLGSVPQSFAVGFSAFIGSWFGLGHYISQIPGLKNLPGLNGTKLIHHDLHFLLDLKQIVRCWKLDDNKRDVDYRLHTTGEVVDKIEEIAKKYGMKDEAKFVRKWAEENPGMLADHTDIISRASLQEALKGASKDHKFFGLFLDSLDGPDGQTMWRTGKSLEKLEENMGEMVKFRQAHDSRILNVYRIPVAAAATLGALAIVGRSNIMRDRRDQSFAERLDHAEAAEQNHNR